MNEGHIVVNGREIGPLFGLRTKFFELICRNIHTADGKALDGFSVVEWGICHRCSYPCDFRFASPTASKRVTFFVKIGDFAVAHHVTIVAIIGRIRGRNDVCSTFIAAWFVDKVHFVEENIATSAHIVNGSMDFSSLKIILSVAITVVSILIREQPNGLANGAIPLVLNGNRTPCRPAIIVIECVLNGQILQISVVSCNQKCGSCRDTFIGNEWFVSNDCLLCACTYERDIVAVDGCEYRFSEVVCAIWNENLGAFGTCFDVSNGQSIEQMVGISGLDDIITSFVLRDRIGLCVGDCDGMKIASFVETEAKHIGFATVLIADETAVCVSFGRK